MEKYIHDKNNGLWYELQGDYYIPCLVLDEIEEITLANGCPSLGHSDPLCNV